MEIYSLMMFVNDNSADSALTTSELNSSETSAKESIDVKSKFPSAKIFVIQGTWGWTAVPGTTGLKNITEAEVDAYYRKYTNLGATLINPKIGYYPSHPDYRTPSFALIGKNLDNAIP